MSKKLIKIRLKNELDEDFIPRKATKNSSGFDIFSCENLVIKPNERKLVSTGIFIELPDNFEAQIRSRSGLSFNYGIIVLNSPGTIDADYRGEIKVILYNVSNKDYEIERGDRIAQMVIMELPKFEKKITNKLSKTERGKGGFGSTGLNKTSFSNN